MISAPPEASRLLPCARQWIRAPWAAGPWDPAVARICIEYTEQRVDATLGHRSSAWWATIERKHWETYRAWLVAHQTLIHAWTDQHAPCLAQACVDWWTFTRQLGAIRENSASWPLDTAKI
ncbi:MAG: hypothetical protein C7B47_17855 [Sulfobacillus thermosulfidooxidans]|uniref:Uncharacterized protein n=1 Tax=Sulfobacillus thermosulfidooxidans TaxID=28034 RepID=A0A2T2WEK4_SULTH|nr:MAG: hypothetical protein C7B47_17855 [Sulfobacillus thermosulfidooxidans]